MKVRLLLSVPIFRTLTAVALVLAATIALSLTTASTPAHAANLGNHLVQGQTMHTGDFIRRASGSASGYVRLIMQNDGNLVLYWDSGSGGHYACWATGTRATGVRAVYQRDGNFVVYSNSGRALWASGKTSGTTVDINWQGVLYVGTASVTGPCP